MSKLDDLLNYQKKITDLEYICGILQWDLNINAPKNSKDDLVKLLGEYSARIHKLETADEYGHLINALINSEEFSTLPEPEQRYVQILLKKHLKYKKVPNSFMQEYIALKSKSTIAWQEAKNKNDYNIFKPFLEKIIAYTKEYYRYIDPENPNLYDVMLNDYEIGMTEEKIDELFTPLKEAIVALIPKTPKPTSHPKIEYTEEELKKIGMYLLNYIGYDTDSIALGVYPHGYTGKIGPNDVRIAFGKVTDPISFVKTLIHEGGHALFENNIKSNLARYSNSCIEFCNALHESQSRFYENILGRNKNFWIPIYDEIKPMLKIDLSIDEFVELLNESNPGLIRTEADELTYPLHIIIRYEIEKELFKGKLTVEDLPRVWKEKYKEYLNLEVTDDKSGLMQDVHWSDGSFGYFPSYLLGTIYDGMFLQALERDLGSIDELLKKGEIKQITNYLIQNIYQNGGAYSAAEIISKLCHQDISSEPIIQYFKDKYGMPCGVNFTHSRKRSKHR